MTQLGENPWILILLSLLEILFILIPILLSSWLSKTTIKHELHQIGLEINFSNTKIKLVKILLGIPIGIALLILSIFILYISRDIVVAVVFSEEFVNEGTENAISNQLVNPNLLQTIIFVIIQFLIIGPCEESFFRGFIIRKLNGKIRLVYAIIFSSLMFTLYHIPPFLVPISTIVNYFAYYFTIGITLSLVFRYSNYSLLPCSVAHSVFNFMILLV